MKKRHERRVERVAGSGYNHTMLTLSRLLGFDGPNLLMPQPGVLLEFDAPRDLANATRNALKAAAQQIGVVIGALEVAAHSVGGGYQIVAQWTTPTPALGVALAQYVVDGLRAQLMGDTEWDGDETLWLLQRRRRAEALPLAAIQLLAEAQHRGLPTFARRDGLIQIGHGARGRAFDTTTLPSPFPWHELGDIPLYAVSGGAAGALIAADYVAALTRQGLHVGFAQASDFDAARALLCDSTIDAAVIDLDPASLFAHGLPFARCTACDLVGLPESLLQAHDADEIARAVALPLLVTAAGGKARIRAGFPALAAFAPLAACAVEFN